MNRAVIIVAGGSGQRMGTEVPKQFLTLAGRPVLVRTIEKFLLHVDKMVVVIRPDDASLWAELQSQYLPHAKVLTALGGKARFDSVRSGLKALPVFEGVVAVHDAVRPLLSESLIKLSFEQAVRNGSSIPITAITDTVRATDGEKSSALARESISAVQTPQCFDFKRLCAAYDSATTTTFTDDASVWEAAGNEVFTVPGERQNIKITSPVDLLLAEALLKLN